MRRSAGSQADLAHVVQHRGQLEGVERLFRQPHGFPESLRVCGDLVGVPAGVVVSGADDVQEASSYAAEGGGRGGDVVSGRGLGDGVAAPLFGGVQARVRHPHESREGVRIGGIGGYAKAQVERDAPVPTRGEGLLAEGLLQALSDLHGAFPVGVGEHEHHLVPADAPCQVGVPKHGADGVAHLAEHPVPGGVAVRVVEQLEVVQVDHHQRQRASALLGPPPLDGQPLMDPAMVVETGERIALGQAQHFFVPPGVVDGNGQLGADRLDEVRTDLLRGGPGQPERADPLGPGLQLDLFRPLLDRRRIRPSDLGQHVLIAEDGHDGLGTRRRPSV